MSVYIRFIKADSKIAYDPIEYSHLSLFMFHILASTGSLAVI